MQRIGKITQGISYARSVSQSRLTTRLSRGSSLADTLDKGGKGKGKHKRGRGRSKTKRERTRTHEKISLRSHSQRSHGASRESSVDSSRDSRNGRLADAQNSVRSAQLETRLANYQSVYSLQSIQSQTTVASPRNDKKEEENGDDDNNNNDNNNNTNNNKNNLQTTQLTSLPSTSRSNDPGAQENHRNNESQTIELEPLQVGPAGSTQQAPITPLVSDNENNENKEIVNRIQPAFNKPRASVTTDDIELPSERERRETLQNKKNAKDEAISRALSHDDKKNGDDENNDDNDDENENVNNKSRGYDKQKMLGDIQVHMADIGDNLGNMFFNGGLTDEQRKEKEKLRLQRKLKRAKRREAAERAKYEEEEKLRSEIVQKRELFENSRVAKLIDRYENFEFKYRMRDRQIYKDKCCGYIRHNCNLWTDFWYNYEQYWLNVYRPFDEYDMEANEDSRKIMHGWKWLKPCLDCEVYCLMSKKDRMRRKMMDQKRKRNKHLHKSKTNAELFKYNFQRDLKRRYQICARFCGYCLDNTCNICLFAIMFVLLVSIFYLSDELAGNGESTSSGIFGFSRSITANDNDDNETQGFYSICASEFKPYTDIDDDDDLSLLFNDTFIPDSAKLSVLDLMFLMQAAYEMDRYNLTKMINIYFNNTFRIVDANYEEPFWFHVEHNEVPLSIISVRGTATLLDAMQDLSLFVEVSIFEGLEWVFPFLNALPTSFIRRIIYYASLPEGLINRDARARFDDPVYDQAEKYLSSKKDTLSDGIKETMFVVGHSLGGGVSQIVAARLHSEGYTQDIRSVGMCSPGTLLSSAKFDFGISDLDITSNSILPRRDIVSLIDDHGGSVQEVECDAESALTCHLVETVICEIYSNCPLSSQNVDYDLFDCYCFDSDTGDKTIDYKFGHCLNVSYPDYEYPDK